MLQLNSNVIQIDATLEFEVNSGQMFINFLDEDVKTQFILTWF